MRLTSVFVVPFVFACGASDPATSPPGNTPDGGDPMMMMMSDMEKEAVIAALESELVEVTAGTFNRGQDKSVPGFFSGHPVHEVTITRDYFIGAAEITQHQFLAIMGLDRSSWTDCGKDCPADNISWFDAVDALNALSRYRGLQECYSGTGDDRVFAGLDCTGYRLPTEAEWEYAARAGTATSFHTGDLTIDDDMMGCDVVDPALDMAGWYCANSEMEPHPVKGKAANAWGLYDTHGNMWEWVHDRWDPYTADAKTDPLGGTTGNIYMRRGGAYRTTPGRTMTAHRVRDGAPAGRHVCLGLRVVRTKS